MVIVIFNIF